MVGTLFLSSGLAGDPFAALEEAGAGYPAPRGRHVAARRMEQFRRVTTGSLLVTVAPPQGHDILRSQFVRGRDGRIRREAEDVVDAEIVIKLGRHRPIFVPAGSTSRRSPELSSLREVAAVGLRLVNEKERCDE
jgi:hypothetical protein